MNASPATTTRAAPLSSADAQRLLAETRAAMEVATTAGDVEGYRVAKVDQEFYSAALSAARERESAEAQERRHAERALLKPEALEWRAKADVTKALAPVAEKVEQGMRLIFEAAADLPTVLEALACARERAAALAPMAGIAPPVATQVDARLMRRMVLQRAQAAYVAAGFFAMPLPERQRIRDLFPNFPIGSAIVDGYKALLAVEGILSR